MNALAVGFRGEQIAKRLLTPSAARNCGGSSDVEERSTRQLLC